MQETSSSPEYDWLSIFQAGLSLLGSLSFWGLAFLIVIIGAIGQFSLPHSTANDKFDSFLLLAGGLMVCGILILPSFGYSLLKALQHPAPDIRIPWLQKYFGWVILLLPVSLLIGSWLINKFASGGIILPVFHILALGIPIAWMIYLGLRRLTSGSSQRRWGLFSFGLTLTPVLIFIVEITVMLVFIIGVVLLLSNNQAFMDEIYQLSQKLNDGTIYPTEVYSEILPYLSHPLVFILTVAFTSVIVPLIEEAIKPLGVWFLVNRNVLPSEGFAAGLLCGAGYGFLENIVLTYNNPEWVITVVGRMGTSLIHMATASLTGWALVNAWNHKKYFQLGVAYLIAIIIHGTWNGLAVSYAFASLLNHNAPIMVERLGLIAPLGLFVLAATTFTLIVLSNHRLQKQSGQGFAQTIRPQTQE